jgi:hypothetical protein
MTKMSETGPDIVAAELKAIHQRAKEAFQRKDLAAYMEVFSPTLTYKQPDGKVIGRDRLTRQVKEQLDALGSVESSYECESLQVESDRTTEILRQTASTEMVHLSVIRRRWHLVRRARYVWKRVDSEWQIAEVEVLEERVTPAGLRIGLR